MVILLGFTIYFFRDPERSIPYEDGLIISPADGRIVLIEENVHLDEMEGRSIKVAIFLSIFDVHVNRIPVSGSISQLSYQQGRFTPAFLNKASEDNESLLIGIETQGQLLFVKQIAGMLARRIICNLNKGDQVEQGERFGMIKFGSRVELYLPPAAAIVVQHGQHVRAGETIIGHMYSEQVEIHP